MNGNIESHFVDVENLKLHYLAAGEGEPVLLLHGWPTSSFLWRHVMGPIAAQNRGIALDLPGFGKSDKPLDASYSFRFHQRILDGFLEALGIDSLGLAVHDLGGPIGLYWACHNRQRVQRLALLNTVIYPQMSWAVIAFVTACRVPVVRSILTSRWGLRKVMKIGVGHPERLTEETFDGVVAPFTTPDARRALLKAGYGLHPKGFEDLARLLPQFEIPVRVLYGERDVILPEVAKTMRRVKNDLPQTEVTSLPDCGHFLQEDRPHEVGQLLAEFFAAGKG